MPFDWGLSSGDVRGARPTNEMCRRFADMGAYDYDSEVSVNILGHVFEQSIADIEETKKEFNSEGTPPPNLGSRRRTDGVFYTTPFNTRHVGEQAVG